MHGIKVTVRNGEKVIGNIWHSGCENDICTTAIVNGRPWHACPSGFAVTLPDYHFRSVEDGIQALMGVAR